MCVTTEWRETQQVSFNEELKVQVKDDPSVQNLCIL